MKVGSINLSKIGGDLLRGAAPTLLAGLALPPPLNLIASGVVSSTLDKFAPPERKREAEAQGKPTVTLTPEDVAELVDQNSSNPDFVLALQQAEMDLRKYEIQAGIRFAEIDLEDRKRATSFQEKNPQVANVAFRWGMTLVLTALLGMLGMVIGLLVLVTGGVTIDPNASDFTIAAFGLIGTAVGFVNGIAGTVVAFYWGSSQGSKDKSDELTSQFREMGATLKGVAERAPAQVPAPAPVPQLPPPTPTMGPVSLVGEPLDQQAAVTDRATPATFDIADILPQLTKLHDHFKGGVRWSLTPDGISVEGSQAGGTNGEPGTVTKIWNSYGTQCANWAKIYRVPVELIVATIATESRGEQGARGSDPATREAKFGLMQTPLKIARDALGRSTLENDDLLDPDLSIRAGTAYIASQRNETSFDPPRVAAAYNARSLRPDKGDTNRWKLACNPAGHVDSFIAWFGDAMRVSARDNWSADGHVPSFAFELRNGGATQPSAAETVAASLLTMPTAGPEGSLLAAFNRTLAMDLLKAETDLAREIQGKLSFDGLLDPPADGDFGPVSTWALECFCSNAGVPFAGDFTADIAKTLLAPEHALPAMPRPGTWQDRVIDYMQAQDYWICRYPECKNIVYLEGVNPDGTLNDNKPNQFNDLRTVFWRGADGSFHWESWEATTEPSLFWVKNTKVPEGAARIKFGQYKAWGIGMHPMGNPNHSDRHEGLVQRKPIAVHRDLNKDFSRKGDRVFEGLFGINQHWGYDQPVNNIGKASAGCLVGRTRAGHREFMSIIKSDPRFEASNGYIFITTILPGNEVLG